MSHSALLQGSAAPKQEVKDQDELDRTAELATEILVDHRLTTRVEHALSGTGYSALRGVVVSVNGGVAILKGRVGSYYLKQLAQATTEAVPGLSRVCNEVDVRIR